MRMLNVPTASKSQQRCIYRSRDFKRGGVYHSPVKRGSKMPGIKVLKYLPVTFVKVVMQEGMGYSYEFVISLGEDPRIPFNEYE